MSTPTSPPPPTPPPPSAATSPAVALATRFVRAMEAWDLDAAFALLADDCRQEELPNRLSPAGGVRDVAAMRAGAARGRGLLAAQRYELLGAVGDAQRAVLELAWRGTLAVPLGGLAAGAELRARIAMAFDVADGRIVALRNYDCYAPF